MKKFLSGLAVLSCLGVGSLLQAQPITPYTMPFETITQAQNDGWIGFNASGPVPGSTTWFTGSTTVFVGHNGGYLGANFNSVSNVGTISTWLFSPAIFIQNGDQFTFYTRAAGNFEDRLQVRIADLNDPNFAIPQSPTDVGSWTRLELDINPTYNGSYPTAWTQYTVTISGLSSPILGSIAFRYFVENGGPNGANSSYLGIDEFVYTKASCNTFTFNPAGPNLLPATVGTVYADTITSPDFSITGVYSLGLGSLPNGLTLNGNGSIGGTPTTPGSTSFFVNLTDVFGCTSNQQYTIVTSCPTITAGGLGNGVISTPYNDTIIALGGTAPYSFAIVNGSLPAGLSLNQNTGVITGTPTTLQTSTFDVSIVDNFNCSVTQSFTVTIGCPTITINQTTLPAGLLNSPYSETLTASSAVTFSVGPNGSALPTGLTLDGNTGVISGTPTVAGTFNVEFIATDANNCTGSQTIALVINCANITLSPVNLQTSQVYAPYNEPLTSLGGTAPYSYAITSGNLPTGLTLDGNTGVISGTPTVTGTFNFDITVTDDNACAVTFTRSITITCPTLTIAPATLPDAEVNDTYNETITVTGTQAAVTYSVSNGNLPSGLALNATTGEITGTADSAQTETFTITATDANNCSVSETYTVTISCPATGNVTLDPLADVCSNATPVTLTGGAPAGGTYSGTGVTNGSFDPTAGTSTITYTVTDAAGCTYSDSEVITVDQAPAVTVDLGLTIYCISAGNLTLTGGTPAGGTFSGTGVSNGTLDPTVAGAGDVVITYSFTDATTGCTNEATDTVTISTCQGIEGNNGLNLVVYPNPAHDFVTVSGNINANETTRIEVLSIDGKLVQQQVLGSGISAIQHALNVSSLTPGVYFIRLSNGANQFTEKFIKF